MNAKPEFTKVVLGIGSNINREENILSGIEKLRVFLSSMRVSSVYESPAFGFYGDNFFNLVVSGDCQLSLKSLIALLKDIETSHGREANAEKFSSRFLDIDVLLYQDKVGTFDGTRLPREEVLEQAYVLKPLAEIEGALIHPEEKASFTHLWQTFKGDRNIWMSEFQIDNRNTHDEKGTVPASSAL